MLLKCSTQYAASLENSAVATWLEKVSFHSNPKERQCQRMLKLCTIALVSYTSKKHSKFSKPSFNSIRAENFQMYMLNLEKAEEPELKLPTFVGSWRKQGNFRKTSTSASLTMLKPLTVWITTNCGKFLKRWEHQTTLPVFWETCMQIKKQQSELDMKQWIGSKSGKVYDKAVYCHPV